MRPEITGREIVEGDLPVAPGCLFLTETQLAQRWQLSPYSIYEMRRRGTGPRFHLFGRTAVRYALVDIETFESSESFASMSELYQRRSGRARARAQHRKSLTKARAVLAGGKST
jgi:hypothetical protein